MKVRKFKRRARRPISFWVKQLEAVIWFGDSSRERAYFSGLSDPKVW